MIKRKNNKRLHISVKDIENEKLKEKFKNISSLIKKISDKKVNDFSTDFKNRLKIFKNDENYELKHI